MVTIPDVETLVSVASRIHDKKKEWLERSSSNEQWDSVMDEVQECVEETMY